MKKPNTPNVVCYGEILWDCFPDREVLGGAPFNVAFRLHRLGAEVQLISALGNDARGHEAYFVLEELGLDTTCIYPHKELATGYVNVELDQAGAATYTIGQPVAWDHIPAPEILVDNPILVFGSLALREPFNLSQLHKLVERCDTVVFDINLRPPHYQMNQLIPLMEKASCIKLNEDELPLVLKELDITADALEQQLRLLAAETQTETICVTLGAEGAAVLHGGEFYSQKGFPAQVVDTVGSGDAFLAAFIYGFYLLQEGPQAALKRGCALGSLVAATAGATAEIPMTELEARLKD
ncbi:carbohydrate kinase [Gilvibacter sp.]|uniref:carbohydrate kinase n=1 Tax=Gilvibacter sp. TaxID=2729997 RepID=UPI0035BEA437